MNWSNIKRVAASVGKDILFYAAVGRPRTEMPPAPVPPEVEDHWSTIRLTKKTRNSITATLLRCSEINDINKERSLANSRVDASEQLCTEMRLAIIAANQSLDDKDVEHSYEIAWIGDKMEHTCFIELRKYTKGYEYFLGKKFISTEI